MKSKLTIPKTLAIGIIFLIAFCAATIAYSAQPTTVDIKIGWSYAPIEISTNIVFKVYSATVPAPVGIVVTNVVGVTNTVLTLNRPSDQYLYITASDPSSSETNYVADSGPSNLIRIRVLPSGNIKVIP